MIEDELIIVIDEDLFKDLLRDNRKDRATLLRRLRQKEVFVLWYKGFRTEYVSKLRWLNFGKEKKMVESPNSWTKATEVISKVLLEVEEEKKKGAYGLGPAKLIELALRDAGYLTSESQERLPFPKAS